MVVKVLEAVKLERKGNFKTGFFCDSRAFLQRNLVF